MASISVGATPSPDDPAPITATQDMFNQLWSDALRKYADRTRIDLTRHSLLEPLSACTSPEDICIVFEDKMKQFANFRASDSKWGKLRNTYIKPAVEVLQLLTSSLKEIADLVVSPFGRAIYRQRDSPCHLHSLWYQVVRSSSLPSALCCWYVLCGYGSKCTQLVMQATKGVSDRYDALISLFEEINSFLDSLRVRTPKRENWGPASRNIATTILAHLLEVYALATKLVPDVRSSSLLARFCTPPVVSVTRLVFANTAIKLITERVS